MRFQVGDIVRLHKDHHAKGTHNRDATVVEITPNRGTAVAVVGIGNDAGVTNWHERSLRLVRRPQ